MRLTSCQPFGNERPGVLDVVGDEGSPLCDRQIEQEFVVHCNELGVLGDGDDVVSVLPQRLGDGLVDVFVEQQTQTPLTAKETFAFAEQTFLALRHLAATEDFSIDLVAELRVVRQRALDVGHFEAQILRG